MGQLEVAERRLAAVDAIAASGSLLRLRGQALNLRSLIKRSRRLYTAALEDLRHAARLFVVEGDLYHLFAVYHNLACLIAAEAAEVVDESRRSTMFRLALLYSKRNEAYCRQYGIGHNSVLNKLLQVGLHRELGHWTVALHQAAEAERLALDSQNYPDAMKAHRHRVSILLEQQLLREGKEMHKATVATLRGSKLRRSFGRIYEDEAQQVAPSRSVDRVVDRQKGIRRNPQGSTTAGRRDARGT